MNMFRKRKNAILIQTAGLSVKGLEAREDVRVHKSGKKSTTGKTVAGNLFTRSGPPPLLTLVPSKGYGSGVFKVKKGNSELMR